MMYRYVSKVLTRINDESVITLPAPLLVFFLVLERDLLSFGEFCPFALVTPKRFAPRKEVRRSPFTFLLRSAAHGIL